MSFSLSLLSLLCLFGASQSLLLVVVLLTVRSEHSRQQLANRLLACFLAIETCRLVILSAAYNHIVFVSLWPNLLLWLSLGLGPLLWFYTRVLTGDSFVLSSWQLWHFSPVPIGILLSLAYGTDHPGSQLNQFLYDTDNSRRQSSLLTLAILSQLLLAGYNAASLIHLRRYQQQINNEFSALERINLNWLAIFMAVSFTNASLSAVAELLSLLTTWQTGPHISVSLILTVLLIYAIALMGMRQAVVFRSLSPFQGDQQPLPAKSDTPPLATQPTVADTSQSRPAREKYQKSGLRKEQMQQIWRRLEQLMADEEPYLNSNLKLQQVATQLQVLPNYLSQTINSCGQNSFFEYINNYRINKASALLISEKFQHRTIADIGLEVGFNTQATFYSQFKKRLHTTPAKFRKQHHQSIR